MSPRPDGDRDLLTEPVALLRRSRGGVLALVLGLAGVWQRWGPLSAGERPEEGPVGA